MLLGSLLGGAVEVAGGRITGVRFDRADQRIDLREEFGDDVTAEEPRLIEETLSTEGATVHGRLTERVAAKQRLGTGTRSIAIANSFPTGVFNGTAAERRQIRTAIALDFDLDRPTGWTLRLGQGARIVERGERSVLFRLDPACLLELEWTEAAEFATSTGAEGDLEVALKIDVRPLTLNLDISLRPAEHVAETAILCRPEQWLEAAVAVAAVPELKYVPLLVIEPPPMSLADFAAVLRTHTAGVREMRETQGALALAEFESASQDVLLEHLDRFKRMRALQVALHPFRSWLQRNRTIRNLLLELGIKRTICLADFTAEDLVLPEIQSELADGAGDLPTKLPTLLNDIESATIATAARRLRTGRPWREDELQALADECIGVAGGPARERS